MVIDVSHCRILLQSLVLLAFGKHNYAARYQPTDYHLSDSGFKSRGDSLELLVREECRVALSEWRVGSEDDVLRFAIGHEI